MSNTLWLKATSDNTIYDVLYDNSVEIAGFQFNIEGATIVSASGGEAATAGYGVTVSNSGNMCLGYANPTAIISAGTGTLTQLTLTVTGSPAVESGSVSFSNSSGASITGFHSATDTTSSISGGGASGDPHIKCLNGTEYDFRYHGYMRLLETPSTIINAQCAPGMNQQSKMEYFTHAYIKHRGEEAVLKLGWRGEPITILENSGLNFKEKKLSFNMRAKRHCETCRGWASSSDKKCDAHAEKYDHTVAELVRNALELKIDGATIVFQNVNDHNGQPCGITVKGKPKGISAGLIAGAEWADASELEDLNDDKSLLNMVSKTH